MVFATFKAAHQHFRQTGALDETANNFGVLSLMGDTPSTA